MSLARRLLKVLLAVLSLSHIPTRAARIQRNRYHLGHPTLCDHAIVAEACSKLNYETVMYYGTEADMDTSIVHAAELAEHLMVSHRSVVTFFERVGVTDREETAFATNLDAFAVKCQELCEKTIVSIPESHRPPSSDVACYKLKGMTRPSCSLDVSSDAFVRLGMTREDSETVIGRGKMQSEEAQRFSKRIRLAALQAKNHTGKSEDELQIAIANMFRVYPLLEITVEEAVSGSEGSLLESQALIHAWGANTGHAMESRNQSLSTPSGCAGLGKTACLQKRPACKWRWRPPRPGRKLRRRRTWHLEASCVDSGMKNGAVGHGCVDKERSGYQDDDGRDLSCAELLDWYTCDDEDVQDSCSKTCGLSCPAPEVTKGSLQEKVLKVAIQAQAYVAQTLQKMGAHEVPDIVTRYFGSNSKSTRAEIRRVLNRLNGLLMNVDYVFGGPECDKDTFAYVNQEPPWSTNRRGQFIVHLCNMYKGASNREKIEVLIHEGTHHAPTLTADVCVEGKGSSCVVAYGRANCKKLARLSPDKALRNADSFCLFASDVQRRGKRREGMI